jgi:DNA-binding transcriptional ArsR family regulator
MPDLLSQTFAALADPTRRAMIARLAQGGANVSELAEPFLDRMSLPAATKHLKVLEKAGLVAKSRDAQRRPCELKPAALKDAAQWMEQYRAFWEESLDRLGEYLETVAAETKKAGQKKAKGTENDRQQ